MKKVVPFLAALLSSQLTFAGEDTFYGSADFAAIQKIDTHVHINSASDAMINAAKQNRFELITINVDYPAFPPVDEQYKISLNAKAQFPDVVAFAGTFKMDNWQEASWQQQTIEQIKQVVSMGAVAIKVWKNVGMSVRNSNGELIMIDDPLFEPVFSYMASHQIPLIGHQAEPKNCWLPVDQMTVLNDKEYFTNHPEYHMYKHPDMPGYEDHMAHRNAMLTAYPALHFVGAHVASLEWSVDRLAEFLDSFPSANVDLAARMGQIQYQSQHDYNKVRHFFIQYADRLLYATDLTQSPDQDDESIMNDAIQVWKSDWRYLTSDDTMTSATVEGNFKGLHLPKRVIDKIYYHNAVTQFPDAFQTALSVQGE